MKDDPMRPEDDAAPAEDAAPRDAEPDAVAEPDDVEAPNAPDAGTGGTDRRSFLGAASTLAMGAGLVAGYGTFAGFAGRFMYPKGGEPRGWMFVAPVDEFGVGDARPFTTPDGKRVVIARMGAGAGVEDFQALSSVCPHLGCQVHWEPQNDRFFCPCHNGVFDPKGKGIGGPPGDAGQDLPKYPLRIVEGGREGLLYIEVPLTRVADAGVDGGRPGHDPCLGGERA